IIGNVDLASVEEKTLLDIPVHQIVLQPCWPELFHLAQCLCHFFLAVSALPDPTQK
ncbi:hypothetical protein OH76DRAFT_1362032, partial [Lentinus brumalis]